MNSKLNNDDINKIKNLIIKENDHDKILNILSQFSSDLNLNCSKCEKLEKEALVLERKIIDLTNLINERDKKIEELHKSNHHWYMEFQNCYKELSSIKGGRAWKIFTLLRLVKSVLKRIKNKIKGSKVIRRIFFQKYPKNNNLYTVNNNLSYFENKIYIALKKKCYIKLGKDF